MAFLAALCSFKPSFCHIIDAGDTRRRYKQFTYAFNFRWIRVASSRITASGVALWCGRHECNAEQEDNTG